MTFPQGTSARLIEIAAAEVGTVEDAENADVPLPFK
jgi:hypothetical protein